MTRGDVVVLRADKIYADYGKPAVYYLVLREHDRDLVTIYNPINGDTVATFRDDLVIIAKCVSSEKNL